MTRYYKQMQRHGEARRELSQRLAREEMGDAEYEKMISQSGGDRGFKALGFVLITAFAFGVLAVTALGF